jgi:hypothetical protein
MAGLNNFLWDEVIQRQLDQLYHGGLKRTLTKYDKFRFALGIISFGVFPSVFGDWFYKGKKPRSFLSNVSQKVNLKFHLKSCFQIFINPLT